MITLVAAVARNRVIGAEGRLPWSLPEDLRRFRQITMGGVVIMGRATYDSIGRALPGRRNVVLSRDPRLEIPDGTVVHSVAEAVEVATSEPDGRTSGIYVIGGAQIYDQFLVHASGIELTVVDTCPVGDARFPVLEQAAWLCTHHESREGEPSFSFHSLCRNETRHELAQSPCLAVLAGRGCSTGEGNTQDQVAVS